MSRTYEILNKLSSDTLSASMRKRVIASDVRPDDTRIVRAATPDWISIWVAFRRHWIWGIVFPVVVIAVAAAVTCLSIPVYEPTAKIEVDPPGTEIFSLQSTGQSTQDIDRIIATQAQILNSDELAIKVIRMLRLDTKPELGGTVGAAASQNTSQQLTPSESDVLRYVRKHLKAVPVKSSQTVEISFASHDAKLSQDVVNTLLSLYLEKNYQTRFEAVTQSSEWLAKQLEDIRKKAEESNRVLANYQKSHNLVEVGDEQSTFALKIGELSRQITNAGAERIQLEALSHAIDEGKGNSLPQVRDSPVVQNLATELARIQSELSQAEVIYGKNHPNVQKLKNSEATLDAQLQRERGAILTGIKTSYSAARSREQLLNRQLESVTAGVGAMGQYAVLKHEARASADLYNTLFGRIKEAGITAASKSSNVRVLEEARLLDRPTRPVPLHNMTLALVIGIVGGVATIFLRNRFDLSLRTPEELPHFAGLPTITFLPRISTRAQSLQRRLMGRPEDHNSAEVSPFISDAPCCDASEGIRTLVSSLLTQEPPPQVILVASAFPREGKTTVAVNLAIALSELAGTCIIDADLRRPAVTSAFGMPIEPGLGTVLTGDAAIETVLRQCPTVSNLHIVPAGHVAFNPGTALMTGPTSDLIRKLREGFRYVIVDSPPLLSYADARVLVPLTDGVILVGRYAFTERAGIERAIDIVRDLHSPLLGFVFNAVDSTTGYGYYNYPHNKN